MLSEIMYRGLAIGILASIFTFSTAAATLQGRLETLVEGQAITFVADDGRKLELKTDELLDATMRDPPLAGRTWEIRGSEADGDTFEVDRAFTIKDGKRYRVTYYCEICHITTYDPGRCMCCQEGTELREILDE